MRTTASVVIVVLLGLGAALHGIAQGWFGERRGGGEITSGPRPSEAVEAVHGARSAAQQEITASRPKQVLFGDFHVHTTFSLDAFFLSLPLLQGEGAHPPADACDFARYCSALDFWSINDHVEGMTPHQWQETKRIIRACNAAAGDPQTPDTVAFLGWEWTQIGSTPENHYGHKNVIFRDTEEDKVPVRPIASESAPGTLAGDAGGGGITYDQRLLLGLFAPGGGRQDYLDFNRYAMDRNALEACPKGVAVRDLPADCNEGAVTPRELFDKLNDWGYPALVIPHGTTWGYYTPPGATFDKQLSPAQNDPALQSLFEIFSGHGNSEEYRSWRAVETDAEGNLTCPAPSEGYLPSCWRAGEIIRGRCLADGEADGECEARAVEARQNYVNASVSGFLTVPGAKPEDWLDAGQCTDCYLPAFNYRPGNSAQYALAITNFEDPDNPRRFKFGFIGSSDNHQARPGTGYKEVNRFEFTEGGGPSEPGMPLDPQANDREPESRSEPFDPLKTELFAFDLVETERQSSFFMLGGLVAVHSAGRDRGAIWDALQRREVYATTGDRILLWFDLDNPPAGDVSGSVVAPMGSEVAMASRPRFTVRAVGAFEQKPGCPDYAVNALSPERLDHLCKGECYNPGESRKRITHIEIVRIRPQSRPGEPVDGLIEDPWRRFACADDEAGCTVTFEDPEFEAAGRDTVYYARAIEEAGPTVNAGGLRCEYDAEGTCVKTDICFKDYRTPFEDDCLTEKTERAWSSPIFVNYSR